MASNELPRDRNKLYTKCDDMLAGLAMYEVSAGVKQNTAAKLRPLLEVRDLTGNLVLPPVPGTGARNWDLAFANARAAKKTAVAAVRAADAQGTAFIAAAKKHLSNFLGNVWSEAWVPVGYNNATLEMPDDEDQRFDLLKALRSFLNLHPDMTVSTPLLTINVSTADSRIAALTAARALREDCRSKVQAAQAGRDAVEVRLRKCMSGLVEELDGLLPALDARWAAFGLNAPGAPTRPDKATGLSITAGSNGFNFLDWNDAARADSNNVLFRAAGQTEWTVLVNVLDSDAQVPALAPGASGEYAIVTINAAGQGPQSDSLPWTQPA
jgi:hypothetical protein